MSSIMIHHVRENVGMFVPSVVWVNILVRNLLDALRENLEFDLKDYFNFLLLDLRSVPL